MYKLFTTFTLVGITMFSIDRCGTNPVIAEAATTNATAITKTTTKVQEAATRSGERATALGSALQEKNDAVPERLRSFARTTEALKSLRSQLTTDLESYHASAGKALTEFDTEASNIKDETITRNMTVLWRKTVEEQERREQDGKEVLSLLDHVLARGSDLSHAANCIRIATSLHDQGNTVNDQLLTARATATDYQNSTNTLLARINTTLASK